VLDVESWYLDAVVFRCVGTFFHFEDLVDVFVVNRALWRYGVLAFHGVV
jgi:hypothetical protein